MKRNHSVLTTILLLLAASLSTTAMAQSTANQWYIKMVAMVEDGGDLYYDDRSGVFGRIDGASNGEDMHDVPSITDLTNLPVTIVFDKTSRWWSESQYVSSYTNKGKGRKTWDFTIYSNRPNGDITLAWDGIHVISGSLGSYQTALDRNNLVLDQLALIDRTTGEIIPAKEGNSLNSFEFNMNGQTERKFRWVQKRIRRGDTIPLPVNPVNPSLTVASEEGFKGGKSKAAAPMSWQAGDVLPSPSEAGVLPVQPGEVVRDELPPIAIELGED